MLLLLLLNTIIISIYTRISIVKWFMRGWGKKMGFCRRG